ncbi:Crp/Fnr family transcriptional regulator [Mesorhizobium sp. M0830]|uniref:Crp/Fnr family transcriptional regulator n=1 Tax=Mesorhizobium sp. M0830 TaxID=2957008 RepID=UPI0033374C7F
MDQVADGIGPFTALLALVAGDLPDLHSLHLSVIDCTFSTLIPTRLGFMRHDALRAICEQHPRIATAFWRSTLIDAAIYREWVTNVGRREAFTRMAHILCELIYRLRSVGRIKDHIADIPITQAALGDALGLSTVHVNRMLQELRRKGLIATSGPTVHALDWPNLVRAGDFECDAKGCRHSPASPPAHRPSWARKSKTSASPSSR